jgi:hypothetical protein
MSLDSRQRGRAGQEESSGVGASVNRSPHEVPALRNMLPLVDQNWGQGIEKSRGIRESDAALCRVIQRMDRGGTPAGGSGLPNPLGTDDRDGRQRAC